MKIQEQFKAREQSYDQATKEIFDSLKFVTDTVEEMLEGENKDLEWKQAERVGGVIVLAAIVTLPLGYQVTLDSGQTIVVDEESQEMMRRLIRVGLPIKLINQEDKALVKEYLLKNSEIGDAAGQQEEKPAEEVQEEAEPEPQFATDDLSPEQVRQMMWHLEHTSKGKVS